MIYNVSGFVKRLWELAKNAFRYKPGLFMQLQELKMTATSLAEMECPAEKMENPPLKCSKSLNFWF